MNTKEEIMQAGKWIQDYWDAGHDIIPWEVYEKELSHLCDPDPIMYMKCKLVTAPNKKYFEIHQKFISHERIAAAAQIYCKED